MVLFSVSCQVSKALFAESRRRSFDVLDELLSDANIREFRAPWHELVHEIPCSGTGLSKISNYR